MPPPTPACLTVRLESCGTDEAVHPRHSQLYVAELMQADGTPITSANATLTGRIITRQREQVAGSEVGLVMDSNRPGTYSALKPAGLPIEVGDLLALEVTADYTIDGHEMKATARTRWNKAADLVTRCG